MEKRKRRVMTKEGNRRVEDIRYLDLGSLSPIVPPIGEKMALATMKPVVREVTSIALVPMSVLSLNVKASLTIENAIPEKNARIKLVLISSFISGYSCKDSDHSFPLQYLLLRLEDLFKEEFSEILSTPSQLSN